MLKEKFCNPNIAYLNGKRMVKQKELLSDLELYWISVKMVDQSKPLAIVELHSFSDASLQDYIGCVYFYSS